MGCGRCSLTICWCLLHARGGVSNEPHTRKTVVRSSPRPWRCFRRCRLTMIRHSVFSTPVEVFLTGEKAESHYNGLLHARGGVSFRPAGSAGQLRSSPRPWRCFSQVKFSYEKVVVFSTPVEVFLKRRDLSANTYSLLHARGGVS